MAVDNCKRKISWSNDAGQTNPHVVSLIYTWSFWCYGPRERWVCSRCSNLQSLWWGLHFKKSLWHSCKHLNYRYHPYVSFLEQPINCWEVNKILQGINCKVFSLEILFFLGNFLKICPKLMIWLLFIQEITSWKF